MKSDFSIRSILELPDEGSDEENRVPDSKHCDEEKLAADLNQWRTTETNTRTTASISHEEDLEEETFDRHECCGSDEENGSVSGETDSIQPSTATQGRLKKKKTRTVFSRKQVNRLEKAFEKKRYFSNTERAQMAKELELSETQVKIWLQNRRNKFKKQISSSMDHFKISLARQIDYYNYTTHNGFAFPARCCQRDTNCSRDTRAYLDLEQANKAHMEELWMSNSFGRLANREQESHEWTYKNLHRWTS